MPLQNRVNPYGQIIATPEHGTLMGNRGCLHDDQQRPLRQYQVQRWIICVLDFKARKRDPMPPGHYTSLFFLDEATALAAGHRPCAECQRERFDEFRQHWATANPEHAGKRIPRVAIIDAVLHRERISADRLHRDKHKVSYREQLDLLPDGSFIVWELSPYLVYANALYPWSFTGYGVPIERFNGIVDVLTPRSTVQAIAYGYVPKVHTTANIMPKYQPDNHIPT